MNNALIPSDEDVRFFRAHGYWVSPKVLSDELIADTIRGAERYWAGERDALVPCAHGYKDWKPGDGDTLRINAYVALQNREIARLMREPVLGAMAARLLGTDEIRLWESELIYKPPQRNATNTAVGWHTDRAYWMTCTSEEMITTWIPLHDCPVEMGPLIVVDRSHLWTDLDHDRLRLFLNQDLAGYEARLLSQRKEARKVTLKLQKGQVSFHHARLLHYSGVNFSNRPRLSVSLHLQPRDNRYREFFNDKGERWTASQDRICRRTPDGTPDYADPAIFPVLFRANEKREDPREREPSPLSISSDADQRSSA